MWQRRVQRHAGTKKAAPIGATPLRQDLLYSNDFKKKRGFYIYFVNFAKFHITPLGTIKRRDFRLFATLEFSVFKTLFVGQG